jgi:preprotein translocase subunit SecD
MSYAAMIAILLIPLLSYTAQVSPAGQPEFSFELRLAETEPGKELIEASVHNEPFKVYLHKEAIITNKDVIKARAVGGRPDGHYEIEIELSPEGSWRLGRATEENIGELMALVLDGKVRNVASIQSKITDRVVIAGGFTREEAVWIAKAIRGR